MRMSFSRLASAAFIPLLAASPATAQPASQAVTINIYSFGFSPRPIRLAAGRPVTLVFANRSRSSHDFTARAFFAASAISSGAAPGGEVELKGNETKSVTLTPRAGTYSAHCSHFMHSMFGMTDTIVVN
jgi:plastocyanin